MADESSRSQRYRELITTAARTGIADMGQRNAESLFEGITGVGDRATAYGCCVYVRNGVPDPCCIIQNVTGQGGVGGILNTMGIMQKGAEFAGNVLDGIGALVDLALPFTWGENGRNFAGGHELGRQARESSENHGGTFNITNLMGLNLNTVVLPIPSNLTSNLVANWDDKDLLENIKSTVTSAGEAAENKSKASPSSSSSSSIGSKVKAIGNVIGAVGSTLDDSIHLTGHAYIGFKELQYVGPEFRQFDLTWTLTPRDSHDFDMIVKVIQMLKEWAAPENRSLITRYPSLVQMGFSDNIQGVPASLPARITDIQVGFGGNSNTGGSPNLIEGGGATSYSLSLTLREAVYFTKADARRGI